LREAAIARAEGRCQMCGLQEGLNVYHRTYERLRQADEFLDLIALCSDCHGRYHDVVRQRISKAYPRMGSNQMTYSISDLRQIARRFRRDAEK